ncbi:MAG: alpha-galactosidase [Myxococcales bacterium]|nr:alpha-galactosidase [Myxococcales bacterium]
MKTHYFLLLIAVWLFAFAACAPEESEEEEATPTPNVVLPTECPAELEFSDNAATFSLTSTDCDLALTDATLRYLVRNAAGASMLTAADYPHREVVETADGWEWRLTGGRVVPDVVVAISSNAAGDQFTFRPAFTYPAGASGEMQIDWVELPSARAPNTGVQLPATAGQAAWIQNGHDSWTFTGVESVLDLEGQPRQFNGTVEPCANDYDYLTTCNGMSWWMGALGGEDRSPGLLWGALAARHWKVYGAGWRNGPKWPIHLVVIQGTPGDPRRLAAGQTLELEPIWLMTAARPPYDLREYAVAAAAETPPRASLGPAPFGWATWYDYFSQIDQDIVLENCQRLKQMYPNESGMVCQIDDGYETLFGDWYSYTAGFPDGVAPVAAQIRELGLTAGLWMAPLLVDSRSSLIAAHPNWFLYDDDYRPVYFHDPFGTTYYLALDVTVPEAADHLAQIIADKVADGFSYLKLDFLVGGAYEGRHADGSTALEAYHRAMEIIADAAGDDVFLLASGQPWLPSLGHFNAARTSSDVAGSFPGIPLYTTMVNLSRYHAVRSVVDGLWFGCDPDNLLVRPPLIESQAQTVMAMTYLSGRSLLGDSLVELPADRAVLITADDAENLRQTSGRFWTVDLLAEKVLWPIVTPAFDLLLMANAAPRIWVRAPEEGTDERLVAVFAWTLTETVTQFIDRDLAADYSNGAKIEKVFGSADATLRRSDLGVWYAYAPNQSVGVFRVTKP